MRLAKEAGGPSTGRINRVGIAPVAAFVASSRPAPPVTLGRAATALQRHRWAWAHFYLRHTPSLRGLKHLDDPSRHRATSPAPAAIPGLVSPFGLRITSLEGLPSSRSRMSALPRGIVTAGCSPALSGGRNQKLRLTHRLRPFAIRHRLSQPLPVSPRGPFMVELFAVGCFSPIAEPSHWPGRVRRRIASSPHRRRLNEHAPRNVTRTP